MILGKRKVSQSAGWSDTWENAALESRSVGGLCDRQLTTTTLVRPLALRKNRRNWPKSPGNCSHLVVISLYISQQSNHCYDHHHHCHHLGHSHSRHLRTSLTNTRYKYSNKINIGCPQKKYSIKVKKKCTKKWKWLRRELKIWYMYNNSMVNLFTKKFFFNIAFYSQYSHSNV